MLPEIDIEVLEATGEWVSLRSISEGAFVRQQEPTSAEPYAQPCNLPFEHFERAVFGGKTVDSLEYRTKLTAGR